MAASSRPRRNPKPRPRLPLSTFSSIPKSSPLVPLQVPNFSVLEHPGSVLDANVIVHDDKYQLTSYKEKVENELGSRIGGVVLFFRTDAVLDLDLLKFRFDTSDIPIVIISFPFRLEDKDHELPPKIQSMAQFSLHTVFNSCTPEGVASLRWALHQNRPVDIDIKENLSDEIFESFGDITQKATVGLSSVPPIILSNLLPSHSYFDLPIAKLMNHPIYQRFQSRIASLSLFPYVFAKFLPPSSSTTIVNESEIQGMEEWKPRVKMYLAPILEAFGYQRVLYGSSFCLTSKASPTTSVWYNIMRDSLIELGLDKVAIDAVFYENAKKVYKFSVQN